MTAGYAAYERELDERNLIDSDGLVVETAALMDSPVGEEIAERWEYGRVKLEDEADEF
ncbi:hypothetical protein [Halorubrum kocurii]|uniref:UvrD/REP helicase n=1 Tax=Halorubrum kocurii JCM 14978 TaxID=1230456 RepID=M0NNC2_9EURY|nr:hypothetical protein [Halorubrum kocurii]EMA59437.1 UvrD/REP helicase [Halorubrum kocurii JCM 14978]